MTSSPSIKDLLALCKLKVVSLILLTAVVGMLLAVPYVPNLLLIVIASIGISLSAMSAAVFNHIIDEKLNWVFGKGHLVIVGDVFDRGPKINEMLWLLYKLEIQAKETGGRLHFLLGNHEYMVLHKDLRYVHDRYKVSSKLLGLEYDELYSNQTIIGRWLRSKSTIIKINNSIFVHGGVSEEFITKNGIDLSDTNQIMRSSIQRSKQEMKSTDFYKTMTFLKDGRRTSFERCSPIFKLPGS